MNDEQAVNYDAGNNQEVVSSREQRLIQQIKKQLLNTYNLNLPFETVEQFFSALPEKYRKMAIQVLAEQLVTSMKFHLLHTVATFHQQAGEEGIDKEERNETLEEAEADIHDIMTLSHRLTINTLGDLFKLGKITASVQNLSQSDSAEEAQRWLYNLPTVYQGRLEREHLTEKEFSAIIPFPVIPVAMQVKFRRLQATTDTSSRPEHPVQPSLTGQITQTDESAQWGKILSLPQQHNMPTYQQRTNLSKESRVYLS
ncbi:MAG TPA: hypothetical protein VFV38_36980 [Ktedonobacteraceae bacterium]|nr:hypothetical protein [Ktedonobacteraceae bacterium]